MILWWYSFFHVFQTVLLDLTYIEKEEARHEVQGIECEVRRNMK